MSSDRTIDSTDALARRVSYGPHRIFVSYRRMDTLPWAGRLADDLRRRFGEDRVFRDVDSNRPTMEYKAVIDKTLAECRVVLALLGPQWLSCVDANGQRRLLDPADLVRIELEQAMAAGTPILPIFLGGAGCPPTSHLPPSLQSLPDIEGMRLSDEEWHYDLGRIIERVENTGVLPPPALGGDAESMSARVVRNVTSVRRYERTFNAARPRLYRAVLGAVELLKYPRTLEDAQAAEVRLTIYRRQVIVKVVDAGPGRSTAIVEMTSARTAALVASAFLGPWGLATALGGVTLRTLERRFAVGFLDNVQGVLEGRGIGSDSSLPPGVEALHNRRHEV